MGHQAENRFLVSVWGCNWKCLDRIFPEIHAFNLTIDKVAGSKEGKCGLKHVIHTPGGPVWASVEKTYTEQ